MTKFCRSHAWSKYGNLPKINLKKEFYFVILENNSCVLYIYLTLIILGITEHILPLHQCAKPTNFLFER